MMALMRTRAYITAFFLTLSRSKYVKLHSHQRDATGTRLSGRHAAVGFYHHPNSATANVGVDPAISNVLIRKIDLCHPRVGATLFVGRAVGRIRTEQVTKQLWPFYGVVFLY
jgi:Tripartite ATP-independent periplasmic transporter, DctM component